MYDWSVEEIENYHKWLKENKPNEKQIKEYLNNINKDKKEINKHWKNYNPWGNADIPEKYEGIGSGHYTLEEYNDYELNPQDVRGE